MLKNEQAQQPAPELSLIERLRNTPNWLRESYGHWKSMTSEYDRAPFEAADEISRLRDTQRVLVEALQRLMRHFPTDTDMVEAGWSANEVNEACDAHDAASAALASVEKPESVHLAVPSDGEVTAPLPLTCWGLSGFCAEVGHKCRTAGECVYAPPAPEQQEPSEPSGVEVTARDAGWQPIETAPKDGTEILVWREDAGVFMARYTCPNSLSTMTDRERDELDEESLFAEDWFGGDSELGGFRLDGTEVPTHWMPLPQEPKP